MRRRRCYYCGRVGTRGFELVDGLDACANLDACMVRGRIEVALDPKRPPWSDALAEVLALFEAEWPQGRDAHGEAVPDSEWRMGWARAASRVPAAIVVSALRTGLPHVA